MRAGGRSRCCGAAVGAAFPVVALILGLGAPIVAGAADFRSTLDTATILYDAPSSKSRRLFVLNRSYPVEVMVSVEGWTKVRDAGGSTGWIESRALGSRRMVVVKNPVAEVRASPDDNAAVAFKVARNVLLEWVETLPSGWARVRHADAGQGFVRTSDIWGA